MSSQSLFRDSPVEIEGEEKLAGMLTRLNDNTDNWHQEITQAAYKQCPYLSEFEVSVGLDKVDEERGFAFGSLEVRPKTAMTVEEMEQAEHPKAHIPVVVKEQMLSPLDVFLVGKKYHHLTEGRLRGELFRGDTFDTVRTKPYDQSLIQDLQPPLRSGFGGGSGGEKTGAARELELIPLLPQLHGRVREDQVGRLKTAMQDPSLQSGVWSGNAGVRAAFESALQLTPRDMQKSSQVVADHIRPNVVQFVKLGTTRALMKWANTDMFSPQEQEVPMSTAQDMLGDQDLVEELETDGSVTMSPDAGVKETMEAEEVKSVDSFGLWKVQDTAGTSMIGWVFPNLLSLDMQPLPLALFTNGSQHAVQEVVAGELAGKSVDLPKSVPQGYGCLYFIDQGTAKAFVPMTVKSPMRDPDGLKFMAETDLGEQVTFSFGEGLKKPVKVSEAEYVLPNEISWMPLKGKTELISEPAHFSKMGASLAGTVDIRGDGSVFSFHGPSIAKVATEHSKFIDRPTAEFLSVSLGMTKAFTKVALDRASEGTTISVTGLKVLGSLREKMAGIRRDLREEISKLEHPLHAYHLEKEASFLDDALTADKVLGLGFLNAENVSTFVDILPGLEAASSKLAELLIAIRIGLKDIPEVAVERMLVAMEDVIRGLKSLQEKEMTPVN